MIRRIPASICALLLWGALATSTTVHAETYPFRPIRLVVPQPPGGHSDVLARIVAERMSELLKQPIIVENRPGAGGTIAAESVARAAADGYTLLFAGSNTMSIAPALMKDLRYRPAEFSPVGAIARMSYGLAVNARLSVTNIAELVAYARARPHALNCASTGVGSTSNLLLALLRRATGIDVVHVPFKGSVFSVNELVAGRVDLVFTDLATLAPLAQRGAVRLIAVASPQRSPLLPDVATVGEQGFPELTKEPWYGLVAPAGTPVDIVTRLSSALVDTLRTAAIRQRFETLGFVPLEMTPDELAGMIRAEATAFAALLDDSAINPDR